MKRNTNHVHQNQKTGKLKDPQILQGILAKDNSTYSYIYDKYGPMILAYVLKNNGSKEDGMEVIQVTLLKIWNSIRNGKYEDRGKLGQFIYSVAANTWKQELRKKRQLPTQSLGENALTIKDTSQEDLFWKIAQDNKINTIFEGIDRLDDTCKELIQLFHLKKVSLLEIAERKNYPYNNLKKRIFNCRKKLKKIVKEMMEHNSAIT